MSKISNLSWGDRFALIKHFNPSDAAICAAFNLSQSELDTARNLLQAGTFAVAQNVDVSKYEGIFDVQASDSTTPVVTSTPVKVKTATVHTKPETATKKVVVKTPQKRGRKGDKIVKALQAVSTTPMKVNDFIKQYNVSLAVLRQSKRFIGNLDAATQKSIGKINVRMDKGSKELMIWKEDV